MTLARDVSVAREPGIFCDPTVHLTLATSAIAVCREAGNGPPDDGITIAVVDRVDDAIVVVRQELG